MGLEVGDNALEPEKFGSWIGASRTPVAKDECDELIHGLDSLEAHSLMGWEHLSSGQLLSPDTKRGGSVWTL